MSIPTHPLPADDQATSAPADTDEPCAVAASALLLSTLASIRDHFAADDLVGEVA